MDWLNESIKSGYGSRLREKNGSGYSSQAWRVEYRPGARAVVHVLLHGMEWSWYPRFEEQGKGLELRCQCRHGFLLGAARFFTGIAVVFGLLQLLAQETFPLAGCARIFAQGSGNILPAQFVQAFDAPEGQALQQQRQQEDRGRSFSQCGMATGTAGGQLSKETRDRQARMGRDVHTFVRKQVPGPQSHTMPLLSGTTVPDASVKAYSAGGWAENRTGKVSSEEMLGDRVLHRE